MMKGDMISGAEALIGKTFGNSAIKSYTGVGRMGIVYLAVQSMPRREVALKIVAPVAARTLEERAAFAGRFLQKSKAIVALQHPRILPVYDYGVSDTLCYLVMPYIRSGTLFDLLNREGTLALPKATTYLEQLAEALQHAHDRGVVHGDITPSNIFLDADGRLLLADFALTSIATERPTSQMRLLRTGITLGSLKYMAPEQVMGESIGPAADMYALAVVLYEMLTGQTPFTDTSPVSLAAQQVQAAPPAPRSLRPEIPEAAEQVILRALAKGQRERFASVREMATAFRAALGLSGPAPVISPPRVRTPFPEAKALSALPPQLPFPDASPIAGPPVMQATGESAPTPRTGSLFDPVWQNVSPSGLEIIEPGTTGMQAITTPAPVAPNQPISSAGNTAPAKQTPLPPTRSRLGRKARILRHAEEDQQVSETGEHAANGQKDTYAFPAWQGASNTGDLTTTGDASSDTANVPAALAGSSEEIRPASVRAAITDEVSSGNAEPLTGNAAIPVTERPMPAQPGSEEAADPQSRELIATNQGTGTMKLPSTLKIVQVPVEGQPGRFVTGLLPVLPDEPSDEAGDSFEEQVPLPGGSPVSVFAARLRTRADAFSTRQKIVAAALVFLVVVCGSGALLLARGHSRAPVSSSTPTAHEAASKINPTNVFSAQATATAAANSILTDPLSQNIHNWPIAQKGSQLYFFADGAYHIGDNASGRSAPAFLPGFNLKEPLVYTLTMDEVKGNDSSVNNSFGMILFFSSQNKGGHNIVTFYSFEVVNTKGGQYQFWKYDSSKGSKPWTSLWHHSFSKEFHQGQGAKNANIFTVASSRGNFTFMVNGKKVGTMHDSSFNSGEIGMLVNLKGTEVAFSNLQLTYNL